MTNFAFDRAAAFYDATRGLPHEARRRVTDLLAEELSGRRRCLEVGVGTGRIALPLHDRGFILVGLDPAVPMLERLTENAGGVRPFPLAVGNAVALPFGAAVVSAVLFCHVLHLLAPWEGAVDEGWRVLEPGGALLVDAGEADKAPWGAVTEEILAEYGVARRYPGLTEMDLLVRHLAGRSQPRPLPTIALSFTRTLGQDLTDWEQQVASWTWRYAPDQLHTACGAVRRWATGQGQGLDEPVTLQRTISWTAFDNPA